MKKILVLGCTGSIGTSTLNIVRNMPEDFTICGLTAHSNKKSLELLSNEFSCDSVFTSKDGVNAIEYLIQKTKPDIIVNGIAGAAGLLPSKIVIDCGVNLALANKETVVMAWPLIKDLAFDKNCKIIPVDSEHSAIFSLINQVGINNVKKVIITASGGPFRTYSHEELEKVTVEQALKHPTWSMGKKITIDSASLANKGLPSLLYPIKIRSSFTFKSSKSLDNFILNSFNLSLLGTLLLFSYLLIVLSFLFPPKSK